MYYDYLAGNKVCSLCGCTEKSRQESRSSILSCLATLRKSAPRSLCTVANTQCPPCNTVRLLLAYIRHLPVSSGTGTVAMLLRCWHKPTLLQASHASQATLRSCLPLPSSGFRHSPRCSHGGLVATALFLRCRASNSFIAPANE